MIAYKYSFRADLKLSSKSMFLSGTGAPFEVSPKTIFICDHLYTSEDKLRKHSRAQWVWFLLSGSGYEDSMDNTPCYIT